MKIELRKNAATQLLFLFASKCTSIFHAAFTCPIQKITSNESSVCFSMLAFIFTFTLNPPPFPHPLFSVPFAFIFIYFRYCALLVINYALGCLAKSFLLAKIKCNFEFDWAQSDTKRENTENAEGARKRKKNRQWWWCSAGVLEWNTLDALGIPSLFLSINSMNVPIPLVAVQFVRIADKMYTFHFVFVFGVCTEARTRRKRHTVIAAATAVISHRGGGSRIQNGENFLS